jgi:hypothetical protein
MKSIHVDTPEALKQYKADCAADRRRDREAIKLSSVDTLPPEHDTEFVGKTIYIPPQLVGEYLTKQDLRLLVV